MKRVLFAIDTMAGGGAEKVLLTVLRRLDRRKFSPELLVFVREGKNLQNIPEDVKVHFVFDSSERKEANLSRFFRRCVRSFVIRVVRKFPSAFSMFSHIDGYYDVGVSFCEGINTLLFVAHRAKFGRIISWLHIDISKHKFVLRKEEYLDSLKIFDHIVCISNGIREILLNSSHSLKPEAISVIYNPIEVEEIRKESNAPLNVPAVKTPGHLVVSVGRFSRMKRFDRLISATAKLLAEGISVNSFILGYGAEEKNLESQIKALGVSDNVKLVPYRQNPYPLMKAADLFVSSSDYEGLPLVIEEALLLGVPVLATRTPGAVEVLGNGEFGVLTQIDDERFFRSLKAILSSPDELAQCKARALAQQCKFPFNNSISKIEEILS